MPGCLVLAVSLPAMLAATPLPQAIAANVAVLVLLDASGSMKEAVEGGIKHDLARRGLLRTLESLPDNALAALRLLGEGDADDECAASRRAVSFAPFNRATWDSALDAVRWDGATPLVYSLRDALADLRDVDAVRREMIIIGDGEETCGDDPVGVARAEAGDVRIHTISLGKDISQQLAGIALVTGGTYSRAFDESSFAVAAGGAMLEPAAGGLAPPSAGAIPGRLEVILDVSNSMWGQVDGRAKIELAREALAAALLELPADVQVGLRAYGHRVDFEDKQASCADSERLLVPQAGNADAVLQVAATLVPRGQTPIARSLHEAGADLAVEGGSSVILLLTDGVESCDGDPVAVAAELRASGLQVILHTVGLGVDADAAAALGALASAGGGQYFDAPDAAQLMQGVDVAVRSSREFILERDPEGAFPRSIERVRGGDAVADAAVLEPGTYSFTEHMFRSQRYFAVRGRPGEVLMLSGLVCALEIGRTREGVVTFMGNPNMMVVERVDAGGERLRGASLLVRGDIGTWSQMEIAVAGDGLARFRIGRPQGNVHRDMVFRVERP